MHQHTNERGSSEVQPKVRVTHSHGPSLSTYFAAARGRIKYRSTSYALCPRISSNLLHYRDRRLKVPVDVIR